MEETFEMRGMQHLFAVIKNRKDIKSTAITRGNYALKCCDLGNFSIKLSRISSLKGDEYEYVH